MGTVVKVLPIAVLKLINDGELDYKIIAVSINKRSQIIDASNCNNLTSDYANLLVILELWFINYNQDDIPISEGWGDEQEVSKEIRLHLKK